MKNKKKLTREMKKILQKNGFDPRKYLYIKNTSEEYVFVGRASDKEITIRKEKKERWW